MSACERLLLYNEHLTLLFLSANQNKRLISSHLYLLACFSLRFSRVTAIMRNPNVKHLYHRTMQKTVPFLTLFVLMMLAPWHAAAQNAWSLEDCTNHALENNLDIRRQRLDAERADHDVTQSYANVLPSLGAGTSFGYNLGRSIDQVTNEFFTERIASQRMIASSELNIFAGFRTINNIRYNLARQTAFRYDTERMENDMILTIANAYLQILYFEDMVEVAQQQVELSRQQVERTRVLFEGGTVSRGDVLETEAMAAEEEVRLTNTKNHLDLAYLELMHLLELDPGQDFSIQRPELEVEAIPFLYDPGQVVEKALHVEPSVSAAKERISMAENGLAITKGQGTPRLSLNTALGTAYSEAFKRAPNNNPAKSTPANLPAGSPVMAHATNNGMPVPETVPYRDQLSENYFRSIQLTLNIPIFNHLHTRTNIQHARIDLEQARISYQRTKNNLGQIIHQAHADALAAYQEYVSNTKALEAAKESFQFSEQGFGLGLVSTLEYNEAKARLNRAEVSALQSMYEFVFKVKILEFYQGEGFVL